MHAFKQHVLLALLSFNFVNSQSLVSPLTTHSLSTRATDQATANDIDTVFERRLTQLTRGVTGLANVPAW